MTDRRAAPVPVIAPGTLIGLTTAGTYATSADVPDNPRSHACAWCRARPGQPCTRPTRRGPTALPGYHHGRGRHTPGDLAARVATAQTRLQETPDA